MPKADRLDFVDICTPPSKPLTLLNTALDAGCYALCEKPFLPDPQQFDALLARAFASMERLLGGDLQELFRAIPCAFVRTDILARGALQHALGTTGLSRGCNS